MGNKANGPKVLFRRDGDHLTVTFPFRPQSLPTVPISATEFDMPFTDGRFTFRKDDSGKVIGVHFRIGDGDREMAKIEP